MREILRWLRGNLAISALLAVVAFVGYQQLTIRSLKSSLADQVEESRRLGIVSENTKAQLSITTKVAEQFRRYALQGDIERDALATQLDEAIAVSSVLRLRFESIKDTTPADVTPHRASAKYNGPLLSVAVSIDIQTSVADWDIELKPLPLVVTARCSSVNSDTGARSALVTVDPGPGVDVVIENAKIARDVCNPPTMLETSSARGFVWGALAGALITAAAFIM